MSTILDKFASETSPEELRGTNVESEEYNERLELLYEVAQRATSITEVSKLLEEILCVTQRVLGTSASSLLLIDQEKGELYVQAAGGEAANSLRETRLDLNSGIAGWVARHGMPLVSNDVTRDERFNKDIDKLTGFVTNSVLAVPLVRGKKVIGVLEVLNKVDGSAFDECDLRVLAGLASTEALILLASMAATAISNIKVGQALLDEYKSTIETMVEAADARDPYACGHSRRVKEYTLLAAKSLSFSPEELQMIEFGALLHDIGKVGIHDSVLRKSDLLTDGEWYIIRKHPLRGANIVAEISFLRKARNIVLYHHERYDGAGYPEGLKGEDIPIGARLVAVADAFDTMTTDHSYRPTLSVDEAISKLVEGMGTQFCPVVVKAFVSEFQKREDKPAKQEAEPAAKEKAKMEAEEARKAEEAEKLTRKEAERAAKEKAKREAEEARKAEEAERLTRKEAERAAKEKAKREAEEAERAARENEAEGAPHDVGEIYIGDIRLLVPSPVAFEQLIQFKECLKRVENLKLLLIGGAVDKGTTILVSTKEPIALLRILSEIPIVEKVDKKGENVVVTLKTTE